MMLTLVLVLTLVAASSSRLIIGGNPNTWEPTENCKTCVFVAGSVENPQLCNFIKQELSNPGQFCKEIKMC